ncbi:MAG: helix-turn-helix domain-containing protein, partial [Frankia sp.]|nr:helix-turn-helix domain-containing protein [Frankia sp.]
MPITPAPAVLRAGEILRFLAHRPTEAFTISDLARELGLPRATCDAVMQALAQGGLVVRRERDLRYVLGPAAIMIGNAARAANPVLRVGAAEADRLARALGACATLSVRQGTSSTVAEVFDHGPAFGLRAQAGQTMEHMPPFGAAYVAWHEDEIEAWLGRSPVPLDEEDRQRFHSTLAQVRRLGYSVAVAAPRRAELNTALSTLAVRPDEEHARRARDEVLNEMVHRDYLAGDLADHEPLRVTLMSAPIFDDRGRAVACVMLLGPDHEMTGAEIRARGTVLVNAAARATLLSGGEFPPTYPSSARHALHSIP